MKLNEQIKGYLDFETKMLSDTPEYVEIEGFASTYATDRDGDIVIQHGIDTANFEKNPIILYQHHRDEPIGKAEAFEIRQDGLYVRARIYKKMHEKAYFGVKNGILKTFSIGFIGLEGEYNSDSDVFMFTKTQLLEISIVSIPSNPEATFEVLEMSCGNGFCLASKDFSKYHNKAISKAIDKITIKNDEISTTAWGDVDKTRIAQILDDVNDKRAIDECYLYAPDYEKRSTWCCPHHEIKTDGTMVVNKNGVVAAYAALKGAHGNKPDMPSDAYDKAMRHIAKHYREMYKQGMIDEIPEDLKFYDLINEKGDEMEELFKSLLDELKGLREDINKQGSKAIIADDRDVVKQLEQEAEGQTDVMTLAKKIAEASLEELKEAYEYIEGKFNERLKEYLGK